MSNSLIGDWDQKYGLKEHDLRNVSNFDYLKIGINISCYGGSLRYVPKINSVASDFWSKIGSNCVLVLNAPIMLWNRVVYVVKGEKQQWYIGSSVSKKEGEKTVLCKQERNLTRLISYCVCNHSVEIVSIRKKTFSFFCCQISTDLLEFFTLTQAGIIM